MKYLIIMISILGMISIAIGAVFIGIAQQKNNFITSQLREQWITLGLTQDQIAKGNVVDNAVEAQAASNTLAEHLKSIAPSYSALMAANPSGRFDPTNPTNLTYAQGLNLENAMNIVVAGYGVVEAITGVGAVVIVLGLGLTISGFVVFRLVAKKEEVAVIKEATGRLVEAKLPGGL
jgi:hypothetical protein